MPPANEFPSQDVKYEIWPIAGDGSERAKHSTAKRERDKYRRGEPEDGAEQQHQGHPLHAYLLALAERGAILPGSSISYNKVEGSRCGFCARGVGRLNHHRFARLRCGDAERKG